MAYIRARKQSDGFTRYTAVIRIRKGKAIVHKEAKTDGRTRSSRAADASGRSPI